jgi:hypothetical protein
MKMYVKVYIGFGIMFSFLGFCTGGCLLDWRL